MVGRLSGRAIIVTGAGSGIGRAFAMGLAREGAIVGVLDVSEDAAQLVSAEVRAQSLEAVPLRADVSKRPEVAAAFDTFVDHAGKLDVLFNNAGFNKPMRLLDVTEENWRAIMDVNALGTLIGIQEGARRMIPRRSGKIVNTSSIAGRQGFPSFAPYCASKFAVNALTQAASRALAEHDITCNALPNQRRRASDDRSRIAAERFSIRPAGNSQTSCIQERRWSYASWATLSAAQQQWQSSRSGLHAWRPHPPDDARLSLHGLLSQRLRRESIPV